LYAIQIFDEIDNFYKLSSIGLGEVKNQLRLQRSTPSLAEGSFARWQRGGRSAIDRSGLLSWVIQLKGFKKPKAKATNNPAMTAAQHKSRNLCVSGSKPSLGPRTGSRCSGYGLRERCSNSDWSGRHWSHCSNCHPRERRESRKVFLDTDSTTTPTVGRFWSIQMSQSILTKILNKRPIGVICS